MPENLPVALAFAMRDPVKAPKDDLFYTPVFRIAFPHLDEPWSGNQKSSDPNQKNTPAFSLMGVFADDANLDALVKVTNSRLTGKFGDSAVKMLASGVYRYPLRPKAYMADRFAGFEGDGYFCSLRARQDARPACMAYLDGKLTLLQPGAIERHLYAGAFAYAALQIYAYDNIGKGVAWGLRTLVKVADGERFGGPKATTQEEALAAITGVNLPGGLIPDGPPVIEAQASAVRDVTPVAGIPIVPRGDADLMDVLG